MSPSGASQWKQLAIALGHSAEQAIDDVKRRFTQRFKSQVPVHIIAYRGFGNAREAMLSARVLEYRRPLDMDPDALWTRLLESYRRFETDELANVRVRLDLAGIQHEAYTDEEGYVNFDLQLEGMKPEVIITATLALPDHPERHQAVEASMHCASPDACFGVIGDIDDTMLVTNATSILKMMRLTLLSSSRSRVAFSAAAVLYRALQKTHSPFFYVSSIPWNLYEFLSDFMHLHNFPTGPMLLRDFGLDRDMLVAGPHDEHKIGEIRRVLDTVHDLPFILIGDSGQDDTQIYAHIAESYPGRILACYIRDVTDAVVNTLAHRFEAAGVPFLRAADTLEVAKDAQSRGWLEAADVEQVRLSIAATAPMPAEA